MSLPKISVVTPTLNCGLYLEDALQSVLLQDYPNIEYIVVDGASTDGTIDKLKEYSAQYPHTLSWISEPDKGQTDAINKGLRRSTGDWFAWLNADDYYEPCAFRKVAMQMANQQDAGVIYGNCYMVSENERELRKPPPNVTFTSLRRGNLIFGPSSFFSMKALKKTGEFDPRLQYWMDYEMYIRISRISKLQYADMEIANFRLTDRQKSRNPLNQRQLTKESHRIIAKNYPLWAVWFLTEQWLYTTVRRLKRGYRKVARRARKSNVSICPGTQS